MARKTQAEVIADLERKLAEAKAKEADKGKSRIAYLVESIKAIDEKIKLVEFNHTNKVILLDQAKAEKIQKLEDKRALLDIELANLATEGVTFEVAELEEV